jgi:hypothetical protein
MSVVPDYSLSTAEVFTEATRAAVSKSESLTLLDQVMYKKPTVGRLPVIEGLPSWVPDWRMTFIGERRPPEIRSPNAGGGQLKQEELLCHENPQILLLKGFSVDIVLHATEPYPWQKEQAKDLDKAVKRLDYWLPECDVSLDPKVYGLHVKNMGFVLLTFRGLLDEFSDAWVIIYQRWNLPTNQSLSLDLQEQQLSSPGVVIEDLFLESPR